MMEGDETKAEGAKEEQKEQPKAEEPLKQSDSSIRKSQMLPEGTSQRYLTHVEVNMELRRKLWEGQLPLKIDLS